MNREITDPAGHRPRRTAHARRLTIRARLTLTYAGLVTGAGGVLISIVYLFMRFVPQYQVDGEVLSWDDAATGAESNDALTSPPATITITGASDFLDTMLVIAVVALGILAGASAWVGWVVAGRMLQPLHTINDAAMRAATGALDHRVGLDGPDDEIRALSSTFDHMLSSLERSFAAQSRFAANASHELRTPLAATQTLIDVTLNRSDVSSAELRDMAVKVREINHGNIQTVEALLDLAALDAAMLQIEPVTLVRTAEAVLADLDPIVRERNITVSVVTPDSSHVEADAILVRQAVRNLIHNGLRHNVLGGTLTITVRGDDRSVTLWVANSGPMVSPDKVELLREPLVRGAGRVAGAERGHGLGLAIASSIADAHGGSLHVIANEDGGLRVGLELPRFPRGGRRNRGMV